MLHDVIEVYLLALLYDAAVQRETLDRRINGNRYYPRTPSQCAHQRGRIELAEHLSIGWAA